MRIYDPRIGKFLSVDPLTKEYPELTPYQFASNTPIQAIDLDGLEQYFFDLAIDAQTGKPKITLTKTIETYKTPEGVEVQFLLTYNIQYKGSTYTFNDAGGNYGLVPENNIDNFEYWYYQKLNGKNDIPEFSDVFYSKIEAQGRLLDEILNEWGAGLAAALEGAPRGSGTIYEVPGSSTPSGRPYVGRHNRPTPNSTRKSDDGRDRTKAKVIDRYNENNPKEGQYKEQKAIDLRGGIKNLDNRRNEVNRLRMQSLEKKFGGKGGYVLPPSKKAEKQKKDAEREEFYYRLNHG